MNVLQLLTTVPVPELVEAYNKLYDGPLDARFYQNTFLPVIRNKVLIKPSFEVVLNHYRMSHDDPCDDEERVDVLILEGTEEFAMSFTPWGELLAAEVKCNIHYPVSLAEQAAYIFWEMTFYGMEEETIAAGDDLRDIVEELDRNMAEHERLIEEGLAEKGALPDGLVEWDMDSLFPNETEEDRQARHTRMDAIRLNMATQKVFKNGVCINHR